MGRHNSILSSKRRFARRWLIICAIPTLLPIGYYLYLDYMGDYWFETGHAEYWKDRKAKEAVWLGDWKCDKPESVYPYCVESRHKAMKAHPDYEELHTRSAYANGYRMDASNWSTVAAAALAMLFIPPVMIVVVSLMRRDSTHD